MGSAEKKVPLSLRVPKSLDDFFILISTKTILVEGKTITIRKDKSQMYTQALEFAVENCELWLRSKPKV